MLAVVAVLSCPAVAGAAFPGRDGLIAFTRSVGSEPGQTYVVRPDGRGLRRLTHRKHGAGAAAWAPDGWRLAFVAQARNGSVQVFVKRLGGDTRQVTRGPGGYSSPAWSPDGRRLVAVRGASGRDGLYRESLVVMRVDGSRKRVVYDGGELGASHPAWSPDGRTIAFTHTDVGVTGADPNLYLVPAAGGGAQRVTEFGSQEHPDWSPDGRLLAFSWALDLGTQDHPGHPPRQPRRDPGHR